MSYIGAEPNTVFRVAPVKDTFTGDGSTVAFDLANSVPAGGENALQVFVENVRQEPGSGKAYTLGADGSGDLKRITFSAAPVSSAEIYVLTNFDNEAFINTDLNGQELLLDADGDTSITADTDDQIDIKIAGADDFQIVANNFKVLSGSTLTIESGATITNSGTANNFGISALDDLTAGDAAANLTTTAGNITIDAQGNDTDIIFKGTDGGTDTTFLTIDGSEGGDLLVGTSPKISSNGAIANFTNHNGSATETALATSDGNEKVRCFNDGKVTIESNGSERLRIDSSGKISTGGETASDADTGGITINHGANDGNAMTFKNSDCAHGMTTVAETDTYGEFTKCENSNGGFRVRGLSDASGYSALDLFGDMGGASNTGEAEHVNGVIHIDGAIKSGTDRGAMGADENTVCIKNAGTTEVIFKGDGEIFSNQSSTVGTFDAYEDAQLIRAYDLSHMKGVINSKFDKFVKYNKKDLADARLIGKDENGNPTSFVNWTGMSRLHNGAIWQQYEKHNQLLEAVYDLAKEAIGEEKANAILEKHEVKRLQ